MKPICVAAFAAHPDDVELSCAGTLLMMKAQGHRVGVVDLTRGELGTRGTAEIRAQESAASTQILGLDFRLNLGLPDGQVQNTQEQRLAVIAGIRAVRPDVLLANAPYDRHPDHMNAAVLVREAAFLAGLHNIETQDEDGKPQAPWRPNLVMHYVQDRFMEPDIIMDITEAHETKMKAVRAFKSQFYDPNSNEPDTYISSPGFLENVVTRALEFGRMVGVKYGEGFISTRKLGVKSLADLL